LCPQTTERITAFIRPSCGDCFNRAAITPVRVDGINMSAVYPAI
jgi:hypothetical protein